MKIDLENIKIDANGKGYIYDRREGKVVKHLKGNDHQSFFEFSRNLESALEARDKLDLAISNMKTILSNEVSPQYANGVK